MAYDPFWRIRPFQYAVEFIYSLIVAVLWLPAFAVRRAARFVREMGTDGWPRANGSITGGDVKVVHGWVVDYAIGRLEYSYRVAGDYYAGSVSQQYPDEQCAWDFVDAHRDKPVVVRYKDDKAQTSVVRDADREPSWAEGRRRSLFAMVWQHWRDVVRGDQEPASDDETLEADDEERDPVGR